MASDSVGAGRHFISSQKSFEEVTFQAELKPEWVVIPGSDRALGRGPRWDEGPGPGPDRGPG